MYYAVKEEFAEQLGLHIVGDNGEVELSSSLMAQVAKRAPIAPAAGTNGTSAPSTPTSSSKKFFSDPESAPTAANDVDLLFFYVVSVANDGSSARLRPFSPDAARIWAGASTYKWNPTNDDFGDGKSLLTKYMTFLHGEMPPRWLQTLRAAMKHWDLTTPEFDLKFTSSYINEVPCPHLPGAYDLIFRVRSTDATDTRNYVMVVSRSSVRPNHPDAEVFQRSIYARTVPGKYVNARRSIQPDEVHNMYQLPNVPWYAHKAGILAERVEEQTPVKKAAARHTRSPANSNDHSNPHL
jgi:hypothetical protein